MDYLPKEFLNKMKKLLREEFDEFVKAYDKDKYSALRVNTLKISVEDFKKIFPFTLEKIPWIDEGYYYSQEESPGKHPYHSAGLYYIQEPSAMSVAKVVDAQPGEIILDLCAAPGGKSTQIACDLKGKGLLVSNEIISSRAAILAENMERFGVRNAVITNESPDRLSKYFYEFFDKILVDAPCSGEGMFRKEPKACIEWSSNSVISCAKRQLSILIEAEKMLKPGGKLIYSTCTFSPEENEGVIEQFLQLYNNFEICSIPKMDYLDDGCPEWVNGREELKKCRRIWPHRQKGEGHFIALLEKQGTALNNKLISQRKRDDKKIQLYFEFEKENLKFHFEGNFTLFGDNLYVIPGGIFDLKGVKIVRPGLHLGTIKKNRFEPSHSLAMTLNKDVFIRKINYSADSQEIINYLKGETLNVLSPNGWTAVLVDGFPLGWGKVAHEVLKNHYPKGLRINLGS
ncbi:MAG: hypothetical protein PWR27_1401 [Petroclostridium sp.]|jgi:NOL1/NOP2/sun family putative RNA methylase|nr:hypothetical protein [Petroclostridium sp.]